MRFSENIAEVQEYERITAILYTVILFFFLLLWQPFCLSVLNKKSASIIHYCYVHKETFLLVCVHNLRSERGKTSDKGSVISAFTKSCTLDTATT